MCQNVVNHECLPWVAFWGVIKGIRNRPPPLAHGIQNVWLMKLVVEKKRAIMHIIKTAKPTTRASQVRGLTTQTSS